MGMAIFLLLCAASAFAEQLTVEQAIGRLKNSKGMHRVQGVDSIRLELAYTESMDGENLFYVMNRPGGKGSLVLSADDLAPALLGYITEGELSVDSIPEPLNWWLHRYAANISHAIATGTPIQRVSGTHDAISPLLSTQWGQNSPFNNQCTDLGYTSLTGCVATAMAQLMNYYKWPERGKGSYSYTYNDTQISSDFGAHTYAWNDMLDSYVTNGYTTAQGNAVAQLMHD